MKFLNKTYGNLLIPIIMFTLYNLYITDLIDKYRTFGN